MNPNHLSKAKIQSGFCFSFIYLVLFFWKSKRLKLVEVLPFRLWWKVTEKFVNRAKKFGWLYKNYFQQQSFKKYKIPPTPVCCLLIKETFLKILGRLNKFPLTFSWNSIYICMIMQLKRKQQKNIDRDSFKLLIYMYGLRYLQFNQKVLPHLHVSNAGAYAEGIW